MPTSPVIDPPPTAAPGLAAEQYARGLHRIAAARLTTGNVLALLENGPATFDVMIAAIEAARERVDLESYIIRSDEVGQRFREPLLDAARRGVQVRVLCDWIGSRGIARAFVDRLRAGGVDFRIFNPPRLRGAWFGAIPRDHRKCCVVDGRVGITGGIGLGHEWTVGTSPGERGSRWRDTAVRIEGPAAAEMARAFERTWALTPNYVRRDPDDVPADRRRPEELYAGDGAANGGMVGIIEGEPGRLRVSRAQQVSATLARRSIWIADAYFMPDLALIEALCGAARDGIDVRLLFPGRNDHPWMIRVTRRYYRRLLRSGVRVWEWGGAMMHAKCSVADGRYARVGSTDFNPLGVAINFELDAAIDDPPLGDAMTAMFLRDLEQSREVRASEVH